MSPQGDAPIENEEVSRSSEASAAFAQLAALYRDRLRRRADLSAEILAPVSICLVGIVVAWVVLAMLLPLISLTNGLI